MRFWAKYFTLVVFVALFTGCMHQDRLDRFYHYIETGDWRNFRTAIEKNPRWIHEPTPNGDTPLHLAASYGETEMVRLLLAKGADIKAQDSLGDTPLHTAITMERLESAVLLVNNHADIRLKNHHGQTVLHKAAMTKWAAFAKRLLKDGAKIDAGDNKQETALHYAVIRSDVTVVRVLVEAGADINALSSENNTPLHFAAKRGDAELIEYLIDKGANVNAENKSGSTPLHLACSLGKIEAINLLVGEGANVNALDGLGNTPLEVAKKKGIHWIGMAKSLFENTQQPMSDNKAGTISRSEADSMESSITQLPPEGVKISKFAQSQPELPNGVIANQKTAIKPLKSTSIPELKLGNYHALIIGIDDYVKLPKLKTALNDARAIESLLNQAYGFKTQLLVNPDRGAILKALNVMRRKLTSRDNLLVYYAGHGWLDPDADEGYWLPVNADADSNIEWVANSAITAMLRAMKAKHVLVVSDSCYSGKLARGIYATNQTPGYYGKIVNKRARTVLSSGGLEPVLDSSYGSGHSVFAKYFIQALKENETLIDGLQLFLKIRRPVIINSDQVPEYSDIRKAGHDGGDFIFRKIDN